MQLPSLYLKLAFNISFNIVYEIIKETGEVDTFICQTYDRVAVMADELNGVQVQTKL